MYKRQKYSRPSCEKTQTPALTTQWKNTKCTQHADKNQQPQIKYAPSADQCICLIHLLFQVMLGVTVCHFGHRQPTGQISRVEIRIQTRFTAAPRPNPQVTFDQRWRCSWPVLLQGSQRKRTARKNPVLKWPQMFGKAIIQAGSNVPAISHTCLLYTSRCV